MQEHPTHLEAARRLLENVREMSRRVSEEPDETRTGDLEAIQPKAAYNAAILRLPNPPIQELLYKRDCTDPEPGLIVNGLTLRPPAQPNRALLKSLRDRFPAVRFAYGLRLHDPHDQHARGTKDLLIAAIENSDDTDSGLVDRWDRLRKVNHRKRILLTLDRWTRYLENDLLPRLAADDAAPAATTDGGEPEKLPEPTPDAGPDGADVGGALTASKQHYAPAELRPCYSRAKHWYDWGMGKIEGAENMDYSQLHYALSMDPRCDGEGLPDNAATFGNYCNKAGVQKNTPRAGRKESLPRITDL